MFGLSRKALSAPGRAADDAGEDDEADAVADAPLGDELADPHQDDRARGQGRDLGQRLEARQVERARQDVLRRQQGQHAVGLQDRHRDGQVAGVLVDLVAPELTLAAERLERRHDARHQLHDDRGVDVRVHPQRDDREVRQAAAREQVEQADQRVALDELLQLRLVDARDRHRRQQPEDDQQAEDVEDPPPDVGRAEGVEQGFEHGQASSPVGGSVVASAAGGSSSASAVAAVGSAASAVSASAAAGSSRLGGLGRVRRGRGRRVALRPAFAAAVAAAGASSVAVGASAAASAASSGVAVSARAALRFAGLRVRRPHLASRRPARLAAPA